MIDGKIVKGLAGLYSVETEQGIYFCRGRGLFRNKDIKLLIGDMVSIEITHEGDREGNIMELYERKNELVRPKVANVDIAIAVFSLKNPKIHLNLVDKLILNLTHSNLDIILCINKSDLVSDEEMKNLKNIYKNTGYDIVFVSTLDNNGIDVLRSKMIGKTSVFAGPSGVGKSSISNIIAPKSNMSVGDLSDKIKRGKHTTRHTELIEFDKNSYVLDTPGFTSIALPMINKGELAQFFPEFTDYIDTCRFNDCNHLNEPDCKVKEHLGIEISQERYNNYKYFYEELCNTRREENV